MRAFLAFSLLLPIFCGPTGREKCYDDCTTRAVLCFNVLDGEFSEKWLFCGQDLCNAGCDARAEAADADTRADAERQRRQSLPGGPR